MGKQDGGWYGIVALLLGLSVTGVFVYAYRQSIWNWWIRGSLIALSGVIFLVSTIGMADNFRADFDGGVTPGLKAGMFYRKILSG